MKAFAPPVPEWALIPEVPGLVVALGIVWPEPVCPTMAVGEVEAIGLVGNAVCRQQVKPRLRLGS